jgi:hypothetical protein
MLYNLKLTDCAFIVGKDENIEVIKQLLEKFEIAIAKIDF